MGEVKQEFKNQKAKNKSMKDLFTDMKNTEAPILVQ